MNPPATSTHRGLWPWTITVASVAIGSFALGGWMFHRGAVVEQAPSPTPSLRRVVSPTKRSSQLPEPIAVTPSPDDGTRDEWLQALRGKLPDSVDAVLRALADVAKTRPALAIDLAQTLGRTDQEKSDWVTNVMQQWADRDAQGAWQWLGGLSAPRMQELAGGELMSVVLGTMAAHDPARVVANLAALRAENPSESISTAVALHQGLDALVACGQIELAQKAVEGWAKDPHGTELESAAYSTVAIALGQTAPDAAGAWLRTLPASDERNGAIAAFTDAWAGRDPTAALHWAEALSPQEGQQQAIGRMVSDWVESRPAEITSWLGDYLSRAPADATTDHLIETVINLSPLVKKDPNTALQWTNLISDPQQKEAYVERTALQWAKRDRAAATNFVQTTALIPPERKANVFQTLANSESSNEPQD